MAAQLVGSRAVHSSTELVNKNALRLRLLVTTTGLLINMDKSVALHYAEET
jgi:hypothetical protein